MNEHYKMDKSHPDYAEYKEKFDSLLKTRMENVQAIVDMHKGQDIKATEQPTALENKRFYKELVKLDKEYSYLYTIPLTEEEVRRREEYIKGGTTHGKR